MTILIIIWFVCGIFSSTRYIYDIAKQSGEVMFGDVFYSFIVFVFGYVEVIMMITEFRKDFVVWRRK